MLKKLDKFSLSEVEEKVLEFWRTDKIFEKSLEKNRPKNSKLKTKTFVFYEGPPTANGRPGIHHVLARSFKDVIPRFKTMMGFHVPRRAGWDTHGLPVELEVEKKLGLKSKKEIEKYGIAEFNQKCKESVWQYKDEWEKLTERMGFWLDMKNPYITYENSYIESVWNILKTVWDKKLLYKGHKVVPWCPRCGTGLSSHELALGYEKVEDTSVYIKFKIKETSDKRQATWGKNTYILSWTTTPWTLPGNVALAVGKNIVYAIVKHENEYLLLAKDLIKQVFGEDKDVVQELRGEALIGLEYEPLFDVPALKTKTAYKIYDAKFVTTTDGTGVVHTAVMYGEDDYNLGKEIGLPQHHTVDEQGRFTKDVKGFEGMFVKAKETEDKIINQLKTKNFLLKTENYTHEYPFCWRCSTPLIYYARDSWFVSMSKLRTKLIAANKKINWVPENVKEGRFGEWLKEVKDWAISRERYWGTPLPMWECKECGVKEMIGGMKELSDRAGGARNRYLLMRHGEAVSNLKGIINNNPKELDKYPLTVKGRAEALKSAGDISKTGKIDMIFSSDFLRTRETARIVADKLKLKVSFDRRLRELNTGDFDGRPVVDYWNFFGNKLEKFTKTPPNGENLRDVSKRAFDLISELERKYKRKTILIVTHESVFRVLEISMQGWSEEGSVHKEENSSHEYVELADFREVIFLNLPRNENNFVDLHKPYVDDFDISCKKCLASPDPAKRDGKMERVKEVIDVWFDSGSMPFAQVHWPFGKEKMEYPADYISEAIDQTRGWFYVLLAIGVLMGKTSPYKNVICLGLVMDKNGQKMSKSKGNIVDPWEMMKKHGVDAIRWYFYTVNPPGEPKKFDEAELVKTSRQFFSLLYNSLVFFETYKARNLKFKISNLKLSNILDRWILSRLNETIDAATKNLNGYNIGEAGRVIENFVGDLSRWYIRRSRRRFQRVEDKKDYENASNVLGYVLLETSKLIAPFTPFFAEALYKSLVSDQRQEIRDKLQDSVHLADWPKVNKKLINRKLSAAMDEVRSIASAVLAKRAEAGIKVRQPLASLRLKTKSSQLKANKELLAILADEVNVKEIRFDGKIKEDFELDINITHELKEEGILRELIRTIQDLRQDAKLKPRDIIELFADGAEEIKFVVSKYAEFLKKEVKAKKIEIGRPPRFDAEIETRIDEMSVWIGIKK